VARFYQVQLDRHQEAADYLQQRGIHQLEVIEEFEIGYAPGRCLRHWLITLGYSLGELQQAGLVNAAGLDTFSHRIVFPLEANLYGRTIGNAAAHRFLPGGKGGLYRWERVKHCPEVILSASRPINSRDPPPPVSIAASALPNGLCGWLSRRLLLLSFPTFSTAIGVRAR
jgi:hypothetical protein